MTFLLICVIIGGMFMSVLSKEEFKVLWESNDLGGGITNNMVADCAEAWGLFSSPRTCQMDFVKYQVLKAAKTEDCEAFNPDTWDQDEDYYEF